MLSLSTSTLLRMTANRATRMYVRLMSNTIDVPETHKRAATPWSCKWMRSLQVCTYVREIRAFSIGVFCMYTRRLNRAPAYLYLQTCGAGSPHQLWNCCREAGNPPQPVALQSRCHGNGRQGLTPRSLDGNKKSIKEYKIMLKQWGWKWLKNIWIRSKAKAINLN